MVDASLGTRIRARRKEISLTQAALAARAGLTEQHMSKIERGEANPKAETLAKLCAALTCSADELLTGADVHRAAAAGASR